MLDSPEERLYMFIEISGVLRIHNRIPTVFVYPTGWLEFSGIAYKDSVIRFTLRKGNPGDTWTIQEIESDRFEDSKCANVNEALLKYFECDLYNHQTRNSVK